MAKRKKDAGEKKSHDIGGKISSFLMILFIIAIWLMIIAVLIKLDVGGLGSGVLRPVLKDVPVINRILPDVPDDQLAHENEYAYSDIGLANEYIKYLEETVDKLKEENDDYAQRQLDLQAELLRMKEFEQQQLEFEQRVKDFDRMVVYNDSAPSIEEYIKFYEGMYPENALNIYTELASTKLYSEYIKERATYFQKMDAKDAAKIMEEMLTGDLESICKILFCMKSTEVSNILSEMSSLNAARVTKRMLAMDAELLE